VQPGDRIGPYRIEKRLGEGGIGEVFRAVDESLARNVAIKRLRPELAARETLVARFRLEAQTLARLNHPNIATLYALTLHERTLCMVMEYVEGETVSALLRQRGPLALEPALRLAFQALAGIGYAHGRGVIHRDIKGSNLMLDASGTLKIMDFGIARVLGGERHTRAGQLVGTPEFMAPEQIRGEDADERSDLYSLAVLLYALVAGRPPFRARSDYHVMKAQVESPPPRLRDLDPSLPRALDDVLSRALAKDPEARFASAAEMRAALAPLGHDSWADGPLLWPVRAPGAATGSATDDASAELDAPTEIASDGSPASALPLIDAELIDDDAPTARRASATERLARLARFGRGPELALAGFALGALLGLDLVSAVPTAPDAARHLARPTFRVALSTSEPPAACLSAESPRRELRASIFERAESNASAAAESPLGVESTAAPPAEDAKSAQANARFDRSGSPIRTGPVHTARARRPAARPAESATTRNATAPPAKDGNSNEGWEIRWR